MADELRADEVEDAVQGLGWSVEGTELRATFASGDFMTGLTFINRLAEAAEAMNHHPDVTLTYPQVALTLTSHDVGALTQRDVHLARTVSELAKELGIQPEQDS